MYLTQQNGDKIAQQYAGSDAFHKAQIYKTRDGTWENVKTSIAVVAVKRYLSNTLMDNEKQKFLWLFLGDYIPEKEATKELWDMDPASAQESEDFLKKNNMENYVNIYQEKLIQNEGRLKPFFLIEKSKFNPYSLLSKTEKENEFEKIIVLENEFSMKTEESKEPLKKESVVAVKSGSLFKVLDDIKKFEEIETQLWTNPYSILNFK